MKVIKDNKSEIIMKEPVWFRLLAWFWVMVSSLILVFGILMMILVSYHIVGYYISALGILFLLVGLWMVSRGTELMFNQPLGYLTLKSGNMPVVFWMKRTRIIRKEEATRVFLTSFEHPKFVWSWSVLFSILTLGSIPTAKNFTTKYYQVKLVTESGKEVELFTSSKEEQADYLLQRILSFTETLNVN